MAVRKAYNTCQLTWYEIEIIDRSMSSINVIDEAAYPIESIYFRTKEEIENFVENEVEKHYKIGLTTGIYASGKTYADTYHQMRELTLTKLGNNIYLAKSTKEYSPESATLWMLFRIRKHVVKVPDTIMKYNLERFEAKNQS